MDADAAPMETRNDEFRIFAFISGSKLPNLLRSVFFQSAGVGESLEHQVFGFEDAEFTDAAGGFAE